MTDNPNSQLYNAVAGIIALTPLHNGGWNYAMADGHARWLKPETTFATAGVTYPHALDGYRAGTNCAGTMASPCGMWTIDPND